MKRSSFPFLRVTPGRVQRTLMLALLCLAACAQSPKRVIYVRAEPTVERAKPRPIIPAIAVSGGALVPFAPLRPVTGPVLDHDPMHLVQAPAVPIPPSSDYTAVVATANQAASQSPDPQNYMGAIQQYVYSDGMVYRAYVAFGRQLDIRLQPGEKIVGQPALGQPERWFKARGNSRDVRGDQQHFYLRPKFKSVTNLAINTNRRVYYLEVASVDEQDASMSAVSWLYPEDEWTAQFQATEEADSLEKNAVRTGNPATYNFRYVTDPVEGNPRWGDIIVFDNGRKTYLKFPNDMPFREAPVLQVGQGDATQIVNYRPLYGDAGNVIYEVDRLFDSAELRNLHDQDNPETVRIRRR